MLTFELGPLGKTREFILSAGGIKSAFAAVVALKNAAPNLSKWRIVAFRPRRKPSVIELGGKRVDPKDVQFTLLDNGAIPGLLLFIPDFRESDHRCKQIGYLLLDEALGEYDVETKLGLIKILPHDTPTDGERYPLADLPRLFDQLILQLQRVSGRPS